MYKKSTKFYNIPYVSKGEFFEADSEERKYTIIDNMLFAATFGVSKSLFEDGNYKLEKQDDGLYSLKIVPYEGFSVLGILNYCLFCSKKTEVIRDLRVGKFYYVYAVYNNNLAVDSNGFSLIVSDFAYLNDSPLTLLLCTVNLTGIEPIVDENPEGKDYSKNINLHLHDNTNPHGRELYQDKIHTESISVNGYQISKIETIDADIQVGNNEFTFDYEVKFVSYVYLHHDFGKIDIILNGNTVFVKSDTKTRIRLRIEGD